MSRDIRGFFKLQRLLSTTLASVERARYFLFVALPMEESIAKADRMSGP
jgi:hypothetical protein